MRFGKKPARIVSTFVDVGVAAAEGPPILMAGRPFGPLGASAARPYSAGGDRKRRQVLMRTARKLDTPNG